MPQNANSVRVTHHRQLRLVPEITTGVHDTTAAPILADDLNAPFVAKSMTGKKEHTPQGASGAAYVARHRSYTDVSGLSIDPDYKAIKKWLSAIYHQDSKTTVGNVDRYVFHKTPYVGGAVRSYSIEYGHVDSADRATSFFLSEFELGSGRKNEPTGSLAGFARQALKNIAMSGATVQNTVLSISASNVTADGVFSIQRAGYAAENVTVHVGDSTGTIKAALEALSAIDGVTVLGTVAIATGETHHLLGINVSGNATIYSTITVTPGMSTATLQTAIRALGGNYANATVTGTSTAITAGADVTGLGTGSAFGTLHDGADPAVMFNNSNGDNGALDPGGAAGWDFGAGQTRTINRVGLYSPSTSTYPINGFRVESSTTGAFSGEQTTIFTYTGAALATDNAFHYFDLPTPATARAFRIVNTSVGIEIIAEIEFVGGGSPGSVNFTIAFPVGAGNVTDIEAVPGAGYTGSTTQLGNAGGDITITITNPANTLVTISKVSGAGWSASVAQAGSNGSVIPLNPAPITASDWAIRRAVDYGDLGDEGTLIDGAYDYKLKVDDIFAPHWTANESETFDRVKRGKTLHTAEISLDDSDNGQMAEIESGADEESNRISQAAWYEFGHRSGDDVHALLIRVCMSVSDDIEPDDDDDVEGQKLSLTEIAVGTGQDFSVEIILDVPTGTFSD